MTAVEALKQSSHRLRGSLAEELNNPLPGFSKPATTLLKFHGMYQQEDRDLRKSGEKSQTFMIRVGIPGGRLTALQYLELDRLADEAGDGTLRITSRQDIQYHYVGKRDLRILLQALESISLSTFAACGDVVRNVIACAAPMETRERKDLWPFIELLSRELKPRSNAYAEIWIDGERAVSWEEESEPLYGDTYLPRKFKIAFAYPGDNTTDIYGNDLGIVPHHEFGELQGFTILAGGGLGQSNGVKASHPRLADPIAFVPPAKLLDAAKAVVAIHRDFGNRDNRKLARLKYVLDAWGVEKFRREFAARLDFTPEPPRDIVWTRGDDYLGWHRQNDRAWFVGLRIVSGRIQGAQRAALRSIVERFRCEVRLTAQQNLLLTGIEDRAALEIALRDAGLQPAASLPPVLRHSMACPALPTCGQALTEAERIGPELFGAIQAEADRAELSGEAIRVRVTGCPNGCARPYTAEIGIVGQSVNLYSIYLGGSAAGTRLATLYSHGVRGDDVAARLSPLFALYAADRGPREGFGDWVHRVGVESLRNRLLESEAAA
ncbi:MAG: NADPH-dependent assimilatory sulfite reductase hemoprotein subunit [Bryobacteraceae bacterium]|nr:NADPH-dependent assimilatory sulfite reductase hemoprotein subunit [Bryobacteraceae bacterium]